MTPSSFKWVEARSNCTTGLHFNFLAEQVESDVEDMNRLTKAGNTVWMFSRQNGKIIVQRSVDGFADCSVVFTHSEANIAVKRSDRNGNATALFQAIPNLLGDRRCTLEIDTAPVEIWQVSRRALERLFFEV